MRKLVERLLRKQALYPTYNLSMFTPVPETFGALRGMFAALLIVVGPLVYFDASPGVAFGVGLVITLLGVAAGIRQIESRNE